MEAVFEALRSAIGAAGDYGIWIGIFAFFMVLGYSRHKGKDSKEVSVDKSDWTLEQHQKESRQKMLGYIIAIILIGGLTWLLV